jgi:hypothetical protein
MTVRSRRLGVGPNEQGTINDGVSARQIGRTLGVARRTIEDNLE